MCGKGPMDMFYTLWKPTDALLAAMTVLTAVVLAASAGLQRAAVAAAPPPPDKMLTARDIQLSVHARKALADDIELGPANLGVRVQDNVAVLWGPVPSEALKRRAVEVVKKVKGVFEVKDADVYVVAASDVVEAPPLAISGPPEKPTHTEAASPPEPVSEPAGALTARPIVEPPPAIVLGPPLPLGEETPAQTVSSALPVEGLAAAVEQARQAEERYRPIECRVEGGVVVLRPGTGRGEDLMAFARAIAHLPGLTRIVIENAAAAPR